MPQQRVIGIYRGLSDIEDNFKVSKSDLDIQPVYVSREDRINAHVLTCFISLVILRLIQKKTDYKFTPEQIITCLNNVSCSLEHTNLYMFDYRSEISDYICLLYTSWDMYMTYKRNFQCNSFLFFPVNIHLCNYFLSLIHI